MEIILPLFVLAFVGYFLFIVFSKKGKSVMFGAKIVDTIDDEIKQTKGITTQTIRVHVLEKKHDIENSIGIELTQNAKLAWSMTPLRLSKGEAQRLISMLERAVKS